MINIIKDKKEFIDTIHLHRKGFVLFSDRYNNASEIYTTLNQMLPINEKYLYRKNFTTINHLLEFRDTPNKFYDNSNFYFPESYHSIINHLKNCPGANNYFYFPEDPHFRDIKYDAFVEDCAILKSNELI